LSTIQNFITTHSGLSKGWAFECAIEFLLFCPDLLDTQPKLVVWCGPIDPDVADIAV